MNHLKPEFGICRVAVAPLRSGPDHTREQVSQLLLGETFSVIESTAEGDWLHVKAEEDSYRGWLRSWYAVPVDQARMQEWRRLATLRTTQVQTCLYREPSRRAEVVQPIPFGVRLQPRDRVSTWWVVELPEGEVAFVASNTATDKSPPGGAATPSRILKTTERFMGVPYLWGGRSSWGFDCSGLVQTVLAWHGVSAPRDATDQMHWIRTGGEGSGGRSRPPRREPATARAGDLLFFGPNTNTATHVAISAGSGGFLHALGQVRPGSVDSNSQVLDLQLVTQFLGAWAQPRKRPPKKG